MYCRLPRSFGRVTFKETVFSILGIEIFRKPTKGRMSR